jgi:spermidine synthase
MKKYSGELIFHRYNKEEKVEVVDGPLLRTLHFGTPTIQSSMFLTDPFALEMEYNRVMMLSLVFNTAPENALFLGLGGGAKAKFLWKYFPMCQIESVEYSASVIDVAHRYFAVPHHKRLIVHEEEAFKFLKKRNKQLYDLIFIDLYIDSGMSKSVGFQDFFNLCYQKLKAGGILVWNMWRTSAKELIEQSVGNLSRAFGQNLLILPIQESLNFIIYAFKSPFPTFSFPDILSCATALTTSTGMDFVKTLSDVKYFKGYGHFFQDWEV